MTARLTSSIALACLLALGACVPSVKFKPMPLAPSTASRGTLAVGSVVSTRAADRGGKTLDVLGRVRGGYGNPFTLKASRGQELDRVLGDAMSDALRHSGFDTAGKPARRLELEVQDFWCDGYMGYQVTTTMVARLVDTRSGKAVAQKTIDLKDGFAIVVGYGPMMSSFSRVVDKIKGDLVVFLEKDAAAALASR